MGAATSTAAPESMSLDRAIDYALAHQPQIVAARARLRAAQSEAGVPRAAWLPKVGGLAELAGSTANNSTTTPFSNPAVDLPRIGGTRISDSPDWQPYASTVLALGVRQQLYDFGRTAARSAALDALAAASQEQLRTARLDTVYAVTEAYFAVRAAHAVLDVATATETRARAHRDFAKSGVDSGLRPPIERTRAEADLARFQVGRIRADGGLRLARSIFSAAVGSEQLELDAADGPFDTEPLPSLPDAVARADERDPAVREALADLRAQRARTNAIDASARPRLFLTGSVSGRAGGAPASSGPTPSGDGFAPLVPNYDAGIVLSWPIYEPTVRAEAFASERREDAARAAVDVARQRAVAALVRAYENTDLAAASLDALNRGADLARANYTQAETRFQSGLGSSIELADAETLRTEAEVQLAIGKFQLAMARAAVARATSEER
ncbi:TolC family protein [Pendulispora albinea]|uniref:TolC family protein n=1 Tax=Pendulispora albinea TaxID=2741071 RepID=A0ABZ2LRI0_9BACT